MLPEEHILVKDDSPYEKVTNTKIDRRNTQREALARTKKEENSMKKRKLSCVKVRLASINPHFELLIIFFITLCLYC